MEDPPRVDNVVLGAGADTTVVKDIMLRNEKAHVRLRWKSELFMRINSPTLARQGDDLRYIRIWATPSRSLVFWDGAPSPYKY